MTLIQALKLIAQRADIALSSAVKEDETAQDMLTALFNLRMKDFNARYPWPWLEKTTTLQTVTNYETGTLSVIQGSRTVTGTGAAWTTAMKGRFLKLTRENELYEILDVPSSNTLTLREPYIGSTASGLTYLIWKRYYDLNPDLDFTSNVMLWQWPYRSTPFRQTRLHYLYRQAYLPGFPLTWAWARINRSSAIYSTGTVSGSKDSRVLTGVDTSWVGNVFDGNEITISENTYNIESVDSDTQITLAQKLLSKVESGTAYTSETGERSQIILSTTPNPATNLHLTYSKRTHDLKNEADVIPVWNGYAHIVLNAVYGEFLDKLTSDKAFAWLTIYEKEVTEAWNTLVSKNGNDEAGWPMDTQAPPDYRAGLYS